jgi:MscS family membrane protein
MFEQLFFENTLKEWGVGLLIIIGAMALCKAYTLLNKYIIKKIADRSKNQFDVLLLDALSKPLQLGIILAAIWVTAQILHTGEEVRKTIESAYQILMVINLTWFFSQLAGNIIGRYAKSKNRLYPLLRRTLLIFIWIIGIVTALNNVGIKVTTLLGTLGIGGIAIALAAQDTIKNIFGGVTIYTDAPFRIGDIIQFEAYEGTVHDIGLRSTRILTYENRMVTIPNYKLTDASVVNVSAEPHRRVVTNLGLTYDTTPQKMQEAIALLEGIPQVVADIEHETMATFFEFGGSALTIRYVYYIRKKANIHEAMSQVNFEVLHRFNEAGLNFAFPTQTIYLEK